MELRVGSKVKRRIVPMRSVEGEFGEDYLVQVATAAFPDADEVQIGCTRVAQGWRDPFLHTTVKVDKELALEHQKQAAELLKFFGIPEE
mgnify:CR=1 FL=1